MCWLSPPNGNCPRLILVYFLLYLLKFWVKYMKLNTEIVLGVLCSMDLQWPQPLSCGARAQEWLCAVPSSLPLGLESSLCQESCPGERDGCQLCALPFQRAAPRLFVVFAGPKGESLHHKKQRRQWGAWLDTLGESSHAGGGIAPSPSSQRKEKLRATPVCWRGLGLICVPWAWSTGRNVSSCSWDKSLLPGAGLLVCSCRTVGRRGSHLWMISLTIMITAQGFLRLCCSWWACQAAGMTWPILLAFWLCLPICSASLCACSGRHLMLIGTNSPSQWGEFTYTALC